MSRRSYSRFVSYSENKLIIKSTIFLHFTLIIAIIFMIAVDIFFGVNLPFCINFFVINELFMTPKILNYSKINCERTEGVISCSLTGTTLFRNEEKVLKFSHGKSLKATKRLLNISFNSFIYHNDLLVLVTKNEEIYLYTSPDLLDNQIEGLNKFLQNKKQKEISIQTNKSTTFNWLGLSGHINWSFEILSSLVSYVIIFICGYYIISSKIIILNKNTGNLVVLRRCNRKVLLEIPLQKINKIYLFQTVGRYTTESQEPIESQEPTEYIAFHRILILDELGGKLLSIGNKDIFGISGLEGREIARSICAFLQIERYQSNDR